MKRALLSLLLFVSFAGQAALVLPPDISTREKQAEFAKQIVAEMPALLGGKYDSQAIQKYVEKMHVLLFGSRASEGLMDDPDFIKWAAERPDLKTYRFYSYEIDRRLRAQPTSKFLDLVWEYSQTHYAQLLNDPDRLVSALQMRINELHRNSLNTQSQALMAGLGSLFSPDRRREILAHKDISLRAASLRAAIQDVSENHLREKFQSERFGLSREKLTKAEALRLLDESVAREIELILAITLLEIQARTDALAPSSFNSENIAWFIDEESEALDVFSDYKFAVPVESFLERLRPIAKNSFSQETQLRNLERRGTSLIVRELPPHLAVFRSCAGGDCSTGESWAYPFSPHERNFYVYLEQDPTTEIGYLSGNMTKVNGQTAFFLRDITGPKMSPDHIDIIIRGFAQVLSETGAAVFTIAHPNFHIQENHFEPLFSRIDKLIRNMPEVEQSFPDAKLRLLYIDPMVGSPGYDSPSRHTLVKVWQEVHLNSALSHVGAERVADDFIISERKKIPTGKGILRRLDAAFRQNNFVAFANFMVDTPYAHEDMASVAGRFFNNKSLTAQDYYTSMKSELEKLGLNFTRSLIRDFPGLFLQGRLNAKDAYSLDNPKVVEESYALLIEQWVRLRDREFESMMYLNSDVLLSHPALIKAARQFVRRGNPEDIERINEMWRAGFYFDYEMSEQDFAFVLSSVHNWPSQAIWATFERLKQQQRNSFHLPEDLALALLGQIGEIYLSVWGDINSKKWRIRANEKLAQEVALVLAQYGVTGSDAIRRLWYAANFANQFEVRLATAIAYLRSGYEAGTPDSTTVLEFVEQNIAKGSQILRELGEPAIRKARDLECEAIAVGAKKEAS